MKKDRRTDFEVRRCANGWILMPINGDRDYGRGYLPSDEMYVFATAKLLSEFIRVECEADE